MSKIIIFSDGCGYQNRNATMTNTLLEFAVTSGITIEQKYLERGHTQMEVDSVHSTIEQKVKNGNINHPQSYVDAMKECRCNDPYTVEYLDHTFFKDFSAIKYFNSICPGKKKVTHRFMTYVH